MRLLNLAWRNLWRHRRRTLISLSAVGLGLAFIIFYGGMVEGMIGEAKNQLDNTGMGHVEVYAEDWRPRRRVLTSTTASSAAEAPSARAPDLPRNRRDRVERRRPSHRPRATRLRRRRSA